VRLPSLSAFLLISAFGSGTALAAVAAPIASHRMKIDGVETRLHTIRRRRPGDEKRLGSNSSGR
jgi:hypothetical protein